ncbi:MAG: HEAT repeat domain-containing protein [Bacteroidales bacterium]|nr:HEAT repeat domain-containing protein [Bacteroidales bacterium]
MKKIIIFLFGLIFLASCGENNSSNNTMKYADGNIYKDATLQNIYNSRCKNNSAEIIKYFNSEIPEYRKAAVYAIGAIADSMAVLPIEMLLSDNDQDVKIAAISSLGQIGNNYSAKKLFDIFNQDKSELVKCAALVAIGRCGNDEMLTNICNLNFSNEQSSLINAQSEAICLFQSRGIETQSSLNKIIEIIGNKKINEQTKSSATQFLAKYNDNLEPFVDIIINTYKSATLVDTRINIIKSLSKALTNRTQYFLENLIIQDSCDYRIRINAIEACKSYKYKDFKTQMFQLIQNPNGKIASAAAQFLLEKGEKADSTEYINASKNIQQWKARTILLACALKYSNDKENIANGIISGFEVTQNMAEKAYLLMALSENIEKFRFVEYQTFYSENQMLKVVALSTIIKMFESKNFDKVAKQYAKTENENLYKEFAMIFKRSIQKGNQKMVMMAANILKKHTDKLSEYYFNTYFLNQALHNCELPQDEQTYNELISTIKVVNGQDIPKPTELPSIVPDWKYIVSIPPEQKVKLKTQYGNIILQLSVNTAPIAVEHFLKLIDNNYFINSMIEFPSFDIVENNGSLSTFDETKEIALPIEPSYNLMPENSIALTPISNNAVYSNRWFITLLPNNIQCYKSSVFAQVIEGSEILHNLQDGDIILDAVKIKE